MRFKSTETPKKSKRSKGSVVLYVAAVVVALIGLAYLATNISLFQKTVEQYVAQGYPAATVTSQLVPSQLLPGIYEPVGVFGGIAFVLLGAAMINQKIWSCLQLLNTSAGSAESTELNSEEADIIASDANTDESSEIEPAKPVTDEDHT